MFRFGVTTQANCGRLFPRHLLHRITTLPVLLTTVVLSQVWTATALAGESGTRPNIVFLLADDLGWSDTTLYGTTKYYQTPNIERLARRGMTFTRAYSASPLCSPTRSAILTGLLLVVGMRHFASGATMMIEDYAHGSARKIAVMFVTSLSWVIAATGLFALARMAL